MHELELGTVQLLRTEHSFAAPTPLPQVDAWVRGMM